MTRVTFFAEGNRLCGFTTEGHSGFGDRGEDILCAAVTSAIRLAETTINDVMQAEAVVQVEESFVSLTLRHDITGSYELVCQAVLIGLRDYFMVLSQEYPQHFEVFENF